MKMRGGVRGKSENNQKIVSQSVTIHIFISGAAVYIYYLW